MKRRGRPSLGINHVDSLPGSEEDRRRLKVVLSTVTGERTVKEAAAELGVTETRLHEIRRDALAGALGAMAPGLPGRPRKDRSLPPDRVEELEAQVRWLEEELQCALVRTEIALTMPHLLERTKARAAEKKGSSPKVPGRPSSDGSSGTSRPSGSCSKRRRRSRRKEGGVGG